MIYDSKVKRKNDEGPYRSAGDVVVLLLNWLIVAPVVFVARGSWSIVKWMWRNTWSATKWLARGSWDVTKWTVRNAWSATKWLAKGSWALTTWVVTSPFLLLHRLFVGPMPEFANPQQAERYRLVRRSFRRRQFFLLHLFVFIAWTVVLAYSMYEVSVDPFRNYGYLTWRNPILATLIWVVLLGFHYLRLRVGQAEDEALLDVMRDTGEKRKFRYEEEYSQTTPQQQETFRFQLGDDGELPDELTEEEIAYYEQVDRLRGER